MTETGANHDAQREPVLHRAIFRLHFYAGLLVAPFVFILAITGAIYLYITEIEDFVHPQWRFTQQQGAQLPPERIVEGALLTYPNAAPTRIDLPTASNRTAVVFLEPQNGLPVRVYVDPVTGQALGSFVYEQTLVGWADAMHNALLMGDKGELIVELAACWAIVLVLTGLYLWWPRTGGKLLGVFIPRFTSRRFLLRDLHAVTGMWVSILVLFLLVTGLPWAANWGTGLNRFMAAAGIGYPSAYRTHIDSSIVASHHGETLSEANPGVPWTLETAPAPQSSEPHHPVPIGISEAARIFAREGLTTAYRLIYPRNSSDVFTAYTYPDQPEGQRTIHLDQYTGAVINDVRFENYGAGAKVVELGVQIHMGNYFGVPNQLLMLVAAVGAAALSVTGPLMWLSRRKSGLGAPKAFPSSKSAWAIASFLVALGVIFPTLGVTALALFLVERFALRRIAPVRDWLGLAAQ